MLKCKNRMSSTQIQNGKWERRLPQKPIHMFRLVNWIVIFTTHICVWSIYWQIRVLATSSNRNNNYIIHIWIVQNAYLWLKFVFYFIFFCWFQHAFLYSASRATQIIRIFWYHFGFWIFPHEPLFSNSLVCLHQTRIIYLLVATSKMTI